MTTVKTVFEENGDEEELDEEEDITQIICNDFYSVVNKLVHNIILLYT